MIEPAGPDCYVRVHVQPRAGRDAVAGRHGDALKVRVQAPPVDGRANESVRALLAGLLGVPPARIELASGDRSRVKRFRVTGVPASEAAERVAAALGEDPGRPGASGSDGGSD